MAITYKSHPSRGRYAVLLASALAIAFITFRTYASQWFVSEQLKPFSGLQLRILAVGDSITQGDYSTDHNGYRLPLLQRLTGSGNVVSYIGTNHDGNFEQNHHEGYGGLSIREIADQPGVNSTLENSPNVVLLHAGTNDLFSDAPLDPYEFAPQRLGTFVDQILEKCPSTLLIVAQIIQCGGFFAGSEDRITAYDDEVLNIVADRALRGYKVMSVNMSSIGVKGQDLYDGVHPTDRGYDRLAEFWYRALQRANHKGWIAPPV